jgi:hypothetical protein
MNRIIFSQDIKDFLNRDRGLLFRGELYRAIWGSSTIGAPIKKPEKRLGNWLLDLRERAARLFETQKPLAPFYRPPRLSTPSKTAPKGSRPPRYFSKGPVELDKRKNPEPIPYLLTETFEIAQARPVPGNSLLIRSLCRGKGTLRQSPQGLVYLDVDDRFAKSLMPYLKAQGLALPPYFQFLGTPDGAHIPIVPSREMSFHYLSKPKCAGEEFSFEIEGLYSVEPTGWPEVEEVWFFKVRSLPLEDLRQSLFLPAKPNGHSFHIAVAIKKRTLKTASPLPTMRINTAYLAA